MYQLPTSSMALAIINCEICGQPSHGKHFGATSCRACAAFFRRWGVAESVRPCKKNKNCQALKTGWFNCKECRLAKCKKTGMETETFQFGRDSFFPRNKRDTIPETMSTFLGRCNLILFCTPNSDSKSKSVVDVKYLVENADNILKETHEIPMFKGNSLEKLAFGLRAIREAASDNEVKFISRFGKDETFSLWQSEMLRVARWLTYFDNFQQLPLEIRTDILHVVWLLWCRLDKLATTAAGRRQNKCQKASVMEIIGDSAVICDMAKLEIDLSWCSDYTVEQLSFFFDNDCMVRAEEYIQAIVDLNPTDVELAFMYCQLCLHQVGKRLPYIIEVAEKLQDEISNDLHDYYINRENTSRYSLRLAKMMKINDFIRKEAYRERVKDDLLEVFQVYKHEFSHPEVFREL